jgi:hypothetical protein
LQEAQKKENDDGLLNWALEQDVKMFPEFDLIGSSVVRIAVNPRVSYATTILRSTTQEFTVGLTMKGGHLILEPAVFLKVVEEVKGSIAASTGKGQLCRPAQELIYQNARARYGGLPESGINLQPGSSSGRLLGTDSTVGKTAGNQPVGSKSPTQRGP